MWPVLDLIKYYPLWIILLLLLVSRLAFLYTKFMHVKNPGNFTTSQNEFCKVCWYQAFIWILSDLPMVGLTMPKNFVIGPLIVEISHRSCQWNPETPCTKTGSKISNLCPLFFTCSKQVYELQFSTHSVQVACTS